MKRILILLMLTVVVTAAARADISSIYEKCNDTKGVTTVYVTKPMLDMAANTGSMDAGVMELLKNKLDNVLIATSETGKGKDVMAKISKDFTTKNGYKPLVEINDDKENVVIFLKKLSDGKNQYIVSVRGEKESTMIVMEGSMTLEDVSRMTGTLNKDKLNSKINSKVNKKLDSAGKAK